MPTHQKVHLGQLGSHLTKAWSATQASLALGSGEAEFYGLVRATGIGLGLQALLRDAGIRLQLKVWTDSEAAPPPPRVNKLEQRARG